MQHLGNIREKTTALSAAHKVATAEHKTVYLEKALCKNLPNPKKFVCYRGWLDRESHVAKVLWLPKGGKTT